MKIRFCLAGWICQVGTMTGTASGTEIGMSHGSIAVVVGSGEVGERGGSGGGGTRARNMLGKGLALTGHEVLDRPDVFIHGGG